MVPAVPEEIIEIIAMVLANGGASQSLLNLALANTMFYSACYSNRVLSKLARVIYPMAGPCVLLISPVSRIYQPGLDYNQLIRDNQLSLDQAKKLQIINTDFFGSDLVCKLVFDSNYKTMDDLFGYTIISG